MSLTDLLRTALRSVAANKLRAALTMLGVVIGVASVIAMLALGNGARAAVEATFQFLGADQIQIGQRFRGEAKNVLLGALSTQYQHPKVAIVVDVRERSFLAEFPRVLQRLRAMRGLGELPQD